jgi:hypothetical protein
VPDSQAMEPVKDGGSDGCRTIHVRAPEAGDRLTIHLQHIILIGHRQALSREVRDGSGNPLDLL